MYRKSFGARLRAVRRSAGLSQQQVGALFHSEKSRITHFEKGDSAPPFDVLLTLADYFQVSVDWLVGRDAFAHPPQMGGEQMESVPDQQIEVLNRRLSILEGTVYVLERVVRSQLPITPAEWNRLLEQAAQHHADE